ncbi:MAG TPA: hypothetical protein VNF48_06930 [Gammaproteobacteria bacterium]|nr:hypothetical protein [Gammaproteobacteria bacterium]
MKHASHPTPRRHNIQVHLDTLTQLFNSMDPSPFYLKDLDADAEEYILGWAEEYPLHEPVSLVLHLESSTESDAQTIATEAIHNHFANQARLAHLEFRRLMRMGWRSLLIGLAALIVTVFLSDFLRRSGGALAMVVRESLLIGGWVAMWRPMQIYLYEWWPLQRRRRIFTKLARMPVEVKIPADHPRTASQRSVPLPMGEKSSHSSGAR